MTKVKEEFCIMQEDGIDNYRTERSGEYNERHEIFFRNF